jgi:hypothetical protein
MQFVHGMENSGRRESMLSRLSGTRRRRLQSITPEAHVWFASKNLRQAQINQDFGFICHCQICDGLVDSVSRSDHLPIQPHRLETAVGDGILIMVNPSRPLQHCRRTLDLLLEEGDSGMKMHSAYFDAFQTCVTHGDLAHAVAFVELAAKMRDGEGLQISCAKRWGSNDFTERHIS